MSIYKILVNYWNDGGFWLDSSLKKFLFKKFSFLKKVGEAVNNLFFSFYIFKIFKLCIKY